MTERRDLVPLTGGLIPLGVDERPLLTARQQQDLLDATRKYSRDYKVPLNPDTTSRIMGVLMDSLYRATFTPLNQKDRVRPLIKQGLEAREALRFQAEESLKLTSRYPSTDQERVGPFALPAPLVQATNLESRSFFLAPQIEATQQLVALTNQRRHLVDKFAQISLDHLPPELGVGLERFPEVGERVKLVRNMITSFVLRGDLSPLIPIANLKEFVQRDKELTFSPEALEALIQATAISGEERPYLAALFGQVASTFGIYTSIPDERDSAALDNFYRQFAKDLLLLHPALEERQIVISPRRVEPDSLHVWQGGHRFGNYIVPNTDMLSQAIRQTQAKGDQLTTERLYEAIKAWQWLEKERPTHEQRVKRAEQDLQAKQTILFSIDDPYFPLPKEAYFAIYVDQEVARVTARVRRRDIEGIRRILSEHQDQQRRAEEYENDLNELYGENWPDFVPVPRDVFIQRLQMRENSQRAQLTSTTTQLNKIEDMLHLDYLWNKDNEGRYGFLRRDGAEDWIREQLEEIQALRQSPVDFEDNEGEKLLGHLFSYFQYKPSTIYLPKELKAHHQFWKDTFDNLRQDPKLATNKDFWLGLVPRMFSYRASVLRYAQDVLQRRKELPSEIEQTQRQLQPYKDNPKKQLPEDILWSNREARSYILETRLVNIPDVEEDPDNLAKVAQDTRGLLTTMPRSYMPRVINRKEDFASYLDSQMTSVKAHIRRKEADNDRKGLHNIREQVERLSRLKELLDSPLVPLPEGAGLGREVFIRVWKRRADLVYATYFEEQAEEKSISAEEEYRGIIRDVFRKRLANEVESKKKVLERLKSKNVEQEFIERMRYLNLVLEGVTP